MKLFYVVMVMTLTSAALLIANSGLTFIHDLKSNVQRAARATAPSSWTPGSNGTNLKGKMFTMIDGASLRFFACPIPGVFNTASPMMTASPLAGVSVCLRYLADSKDKTIRSIFTLNPSTTPLELKFEYRQYFVKITKFGYSISDPMETYIQFWPNLGFEIWTRLCFTMDSRTNVAQVFSGPNMSIRRILQSRYVWSGEPVIAISGFYGQLTDVQMWDYPLSQKEVLYYMARGSYRGSTITWSSICYSGNALLEDTYESRE